MLAHGFGCNQKMWRYLTPYLEDRYRIVLFDYVGMGESDKHAFEVNRYSRLEGFAQDVAEIGEDLSLRDVHFIGHSVSGMIGLLAAQLSPPMFSSFSFVCPSPCYLNKAPHYFGGFERKDLEDLIDLMEKNYIGWTQYLAPFVMGGNPDQYTRELEESFCSTDPVVAKTFARATFFSDHRHLLSRCQQPALILQSSHDALAQPEIGKYMHSEMLNSTLHIIEGDGHCLHMTHPAEVARAIDDFIKANACERVGHSH
jgi:sigma-B regulation protein RsbQ